MYMVTPGRSVIYGDRFQYKKGPIGSDAHFTGTAMADDCIGETPI